MQRHVRLILPFRLPTWNALLAMNQWERKRVRDWIKDVVSQCCREQSDSLMQTDAVIKLSLTDWQKAEYSRMIVPSSSRKSANRRRLQRVMRKP